MYKKLKVYSINLVFYTFLLRWQISPYGDIREYYKKY